MNPQIYEFMVDLEGSMTKFEAVAKLIQSGQFSPEEAACWLRGYGRQLSEAATAALDGHPTVPGAEPFTVLST